MHNRATDLLTNPDITPYEKMFVVFRLEYGLSNDACLMMATHWRDACWDVYDSAVKALGNDDLEHNQRLYRIRYYAGLANVEVGVIVRTGECQRMAARNCARYQVECSKSLALILGNDALTAQAETEDAQVNYMLEVLADGD